MNQKSSTNKKVVIFGGGVAGMTAAHELIQRGFDVVVYEYKHIAGGKARSIPVYGSGKEGRKDLPGEHGFRFFPGFYKHVTDTMQRIPYIDRNGKEKTVFDNLVHAPRMGLARYDLPLTEFVANFPTSLDDVIDIIKSMFDADLGLSIDEMELAASKLWQIITSCHDRKVQEYEQIPWWGFIEAEQHSEAYQKLFTALTRTLVAAKAHEASTKTVGNVGAELILDMITPGMKNDRVLNGPTNDVWIDPWLSFLREQGVEYRLNADVTSIHCTDGVITGATIVENGVKHEVTADYYISALPVEVLASLLTDEMLLADPTLFFLKQLSLSVDWMTGMQFFLTEPAPIIEGHVLYMDSQWALTSVSQAQFWPHIDMRQFGDGRVVDILSVDISDWNMPGLNGLTAMECDYLQLRNEVWAQLKQSLNHGDEIHLRDDMIHTTFLDPNIAFINPRDKINLEPLLINKVGTWTQRPEASTTISNLFLASDYVRTNTDLATMEGANEAARRAVNAILDTAESKAKRCEIFEMYEHKLFKIWQKHDQERFDKGLPWDGKTILHIF
ncbi:phytoene dehydrogenase [Tumebacillus algifaecis]|uniref:Phytoene dehydrogenase n=1 Tax=Tumebacillus algifaecis TaxID=1214604 RepID=A0A223D2A2_9BACL|nr:FAD-dependent oxidoreductase [Tumebacillus algifaecis]ASS75517.1 phytoene dehydrogenase [Tumebacillus algifaecis]